MEGIGLDDEPSSLQARLDVQKRRWKPPSGTKKLPGRVAYPGQIEYEKGLVDNKVDKAVDRAKRALDRNEKN